MLVSGRPFARLSLVMENNVRRPEIRAASQGDMVSGTWSRSIRSRLLVSYVHEAGDGRCQVSIKMRSQMCLCNGRLLY